MPTVYAGNGGFAGTVTINTANYTKIGSTVWVDAFVTVAVTAVGSGSANIGGLPFTPLHGFSTFKAAHGDLALSNGGYFRLGQKNMVFVADYSTSTVGFAGTGSRTMMVSGFYQTDE